MGSTKYSKRSLSARVASVFLYQIYDGGSEPRKSLMKSVLQHVNEHAEISVVKGVQNHVRMLASFFFEEKNFLCLCPQASAKASASIDCCTYSKRENIVFGLNNLNSEQQQEMWDMNNNIVKNTFKHISETDILQKLWTEKIGDRAKLPQCYCSHALQIV